MVQGKIWWDRQSQRAVLAATSCSITSKIHPKHQGYRSVTAQIQQSLRDLGTDYLDLMLLHYASCWDGLAGCSKDVPPEGTWRDSWRALEDAVRAGTLRTIGVSNFDPGSACSAGRHGEGAPGRGSAQ